jgi:hypothetical protein
MAAAAGGVSLEDKLSALQESQHICHSLLESQHQILQIFMEEVRKLRHAIEDLEDMLVGAGLEESEAASAGGAAAAN